MISSEQLVYLEILEKAGAEGFSPIGWLYQSVMLALREDGLAVISQGNAFTLSELGRHELAIWRADHENDPLGKNELCAWACNIRGPLSEIAEALARVDHSSKFDEDYKVREWCKHLTKKNFDQIERLVKQLTQVWDATVGKDLNLWCRELNGTAAPVERCFSTWGPRQFTGCACRKVRPALRPVDLPLPPIRSHHVHIPRCECEECLNPGG